MIENIARLARLRNPVGKAAPNIILFRFLYNYPLSSGLEERKLIEGNL